MMSVPRNLRTKAEGISLFSRIDNPSFPPRKAVRNSECDGLLYPVAGDVRPCGGGAISEAGEPGVGASWGNACRLVAGTGRVASGAGGKMDQQGDEVKSAHHWLKDRAE